MVKALKPLKLKKNSGLLTGLLTHKIWSEGSLKLIQGLWPVSFIDSSTASVSFRLVTQLTTLTQLCFQPACHRQKNLA